MFNQPQEVRLSVWSDFRKSLETAEDPLAETAKFWSGAPFIPYNNQIDPFNYRSWPTPWDIIVTNRYDDFTKAVMMAWTIIYTERYNNSAISIQTYIDTVHNRPYNCVIIDDEHVLNYIDNEVELVKNLPPSFRLENLVELKRPR
jgi:hypothetical protein